MWWREGEEERERESVSEGDRGRDGHTGTENELREGWRETGRRERP